MNRLALLLAASVFSPHVPRTCDEQAVARRELPRAHARASPIGEEQYYRIPPRVIYKSYPVWHPDREPAGYLEGCGSQEPEVAFDSARLET